MDLLFQSYFPPTDSLWSSHCHPECVCHQDSSIFSSLLSFPILIVPMSHSFHIKWLSYFASLSLSSSFRDDSLLFFPLPHRDYPPAPNTHPRSTLPLCSPIFPLPCLLLSLPTQFLSYPTLFKPSLSLVSPVLFFLLFSLPLPSSSLTRSPQSISPPPSPPLSYLNHPH